MQEIQTKQNTEQATHIGGINWHTALCRLGDLKDYDRNPRKMGKKEFEDLVKSLREDGYHQRMLVNKDGVIIGGHSRKKAMLKAGYSENDLIEVLIPDIPLSPEDFDRINIRDNLGYGSFDYDMLANNFQVDQLLDWGMSPEILGLDAFNPPEDKETKEPKPKMCPHCGEQIN